MTACIITETDNLGPGFVGTSQLLKRFLVHRCGHEKHPIDGSSCIKAITQTCRYIVATQDRALQQWVRSKPAIPLFYLHNNSVPTLVQPSEANRNAANEGQRNRVQVRTLDQQTLTTLKQKEGLAVPEAKVVRKKKKPKNPNPLSCKKPKKKKPAGDNGAPQPTKSDGGVAKKKSRKRVKLAKHVVEHLKATVGGPK